MEQVRLELVIIPVFFAVSAVLIAGGISAYLENKARTIRAISGSAMVSGVIMATIGSFATAGVVDGSSWRPLLLLPVVVLGMGFWVSMLIDCAIKEPRDGHDKSSGS